MTHKTSPANAEIPATFTLVQPKNGPKRVPRSSSTIQTIKGCSLAAVGLGTGGLGREREGTSID